MAAEMCEQEARSPCDNQEWGGKEGEGGSQRWFQGRSMTCFCTSSNQDLAQQFIN